MAVVFIHYKREFLYTIKRSLRTSTRQGYYTRIGVFGHVRQPSMQRRFMEHYTHAGSGLDS